LNPLKRTTERKPHFKLLGIPATGKLADVIEIRLRTSVSEAVVTTLFGKNPAAIRAKRTPSVQLATPTQRATSQQPRLRAEIGRSQIPQFIDLLNERVSSFPVLDEG
jgi:hypothetical protein